MLVAQGFACRLSSGRRQDTQWLLAVSSWQWLRVIDDEAVCQMFKPKANSLEILLREGKQMKPIKHAEKALATVAGGIFNTIQFFNQYRPNESFIPKWSDKPLLKSWQKSKPPLGFPRTTDSLCPKCVIEARNKILSAPTIDPSSLVEEKVGEIKAQIIERDGQIWMVKDCPIHGHFEDIMAIDSKFLKHIEAMFPGRDIQAHNDEGLHDHGSSSIKFGRGSVLTIDLTNRCNMMCDPCFMDANQVGFVHELSFD